MITEHEVRALIAKLRAYDRGTDAVVIRTADLRAVADALEQLLPGFYLHPDSSDLSTYTDGCGGPGPRRSPPSAACHHLRRLLGRPARR
ncbi:MAG: hypothetical protein IRY87_00025 [Acetobacteraceae bacterium]|nr:hypothetical protein [Acetobacteraceae bacterium]